MQHSDRANMEPESHHPMVVGHISVRLQDSIVVFDGCNQPLEHSLRVIYVCNLYTKQWKKYEPDIPDFSDRRFGCCAMAVNSDIYVFGVNKEIQLLCGN